jgi:hypothetical protein
LTGNLIAGDGTKNGLSRSEQKTVSTTQNNRLTAKAPYKFESPPSSGESFANLKMMLAIDDKSTTEPSLPSGKSRSRTFSTWIRVTFAGLTPIFSAKTGSGYSPDVMVEASCFPQGPWAS